MNNRAKFQQAFATASAIFDARPDPVLAEIARTAGIVNNRDDREKLAVVFNHGTDRLPSWPITYLPDEITALPDGELAVKLVEVIDMFDARGIITRTQSS